MVVAMTLTVQHVSTQNNTIFIIQPEETGMHHQALHRQHILIMIDDKRPFSYRIALQLKIRCPLYTKFNEIPKILT